MSEKPQQKEHVEKLLELSKPLWEYLSENQIDRAQLTHPAVDDGKWVLQAFFAEPEVKPTNIITTPMSLGVAKRKP
jgi:hypothetical protein